MLFSVGRQLRTQRELRGFSLQDCAHKTRIPVDHLASLEADDQAVFGSPTYSRSFLRLYARFLNVELPDLPADSPIRPDRRSRPRLSTTPACNLWHETAAPRPAPRAVCLPPPSPLPAIAALFILLLCGAGLWGHHLAQEWTQRGVHRLSPPAQTVPQPPAPPQPTYVKAIPVPEPGIHGLFSEVTGNKRFVE